MFTKETNFDLQNGIHSNIFHVFKHWQNGSRLTVNKPSLYQLKKNLN